MDKWETLRELMKVDISHAVHYSSDKNYEHGVTQRYLEIMDQLDEKEKNKGFLFTDVPEFDRINWDKMLKHLEGLS